jgi:DNA-binding NarL/FixJ family response regulator
MPTIRPCITDAKTRVLVVDSHPLVRRALVAMLDAEPDLRCCGEFAAEAATLAEIARLQPHVVLIDVSSRPSVSLDLIQRVRVSGCGTRVVAMAMYDMAKYLDRIKAAGVADFVAKGELADRILDTVRRCGRQKRNGFTPGWTPDKSASNLSVRQRSAPAGLNPVEREIVQLIGDGIPARTIAARLGLSVATVEACRRRIRGKLKSPSPIQLVQFCVRWVQRHRLYRAGL